MAKAREQSDWLRLGVAVAWLVSRNGFTEKPIHPFDVIPGPYRPPAHGGREKTPEEKADENRRGWAALDRFFGGEHGRGQRRQRRR